MGKHKRHKRNREGYSNTYGDVNDVNDMNNMNNNFDLNNFDLGNLGNLNMGNLASMLNNVDINQISSLLGILGGGNKSTDGIVKEVNKDNIYSDNVYKDNPYDVDIEDGSMKNSDEQETYVNEESRKHKGISKEERRKKREIRKQDSIISLLNSLKGVVDEEKATKLERVIQIYIEECMNKTS